MNAFNGRLISTFSSDRLFRIYIDRGEAFFIQIGGQNYGQVIAAQFGFLGVLMYAPIRQRSQAKLKERITILDSQAPGLQLGAGKHNFHVVVSDFESSVLQTASAFGSHGAHVGRWIIHLRGRKPMTLQLETEDDMRLAIETLPLVIDRHVNQVMWNAGKRKFTKIS